MTIVAGLAMHDLSIAIHVCSFPPSTLPHHRVGIIIPCNRYTKLRTRFIALAFPATCSLKGVLRRTAEQTSSPRTTPYRRKQPPAVLDRSVDMNELSLSIGETTNERELHALMSPYKSRELSARFMLTLISRESDWQRCLALLDWIHEEALYTPSVFAYNVVLRNVLRAKQWRLAAGLFDEMRQRGLSPDKYTYSTLITHFGKEGLFDDALSWLQKMEHDHVTGDLVLYSNLMELSRKLSDYPKAISIFSKLKSSGITPDLVAYNTMINVFGKARLFREASLLLNEMMSNGITPDTVSYSTLMSIYMENRKVLEALSVFSEMKKANCPLDLTTCNIMIDVYGQLDMAKEADSLFWSMRKIGIAPNVITYNTLLRVYGDAELFGEAIHLFRLMQKKNIHQNVVTYNTMIKIYGKTREHEKANNLVKEMETKGIKPDTITFATMIHIWSKAGKLDRVAILFQKLRSSGVEFDQVLYQTIIVAYERAGLVAHANRLLQELKRPDNIPRETAIMALAGAGRLEEAMWVFRRMIDAREVKNIEIFECMIDLFSRNRRYKNVIDVYRNLRESGFSPDSNMVVMVLDAYGKLGEFEKAECLYRKMNEEEERVLSDDVHFQMLSVYGARGDFEMVETLFERLEIDPRVNKRDLHQVFAGIYERANRVEDASRLVNRMSDMKVLLS
ncbi:unnamed protein product [Cuscuta europaea]|uniref:Pentatricopeptide repeat-containing protein n=1 Tax=Cuscuta europaea TaxID=41803 RepID=A0A9P0Z1T9_CUSEU|nr:unnamed protein product [Cuscuta europaea]